MNNLKFKSATPAQYYYLRYLRLNVYIGLVNNEIARIEPQIITLLNGGSNWNTMKLLIDCLDE